MTSPILVQPVNGHPLGAAVPRTRADATGLLIVVIGLLYLLPHRLVVTDLAGAGRPAVLLAMGLAAWWLLSRLHPLLAATGAQPVRWTLLLYLASLLIGYAAGQFRGLTELEQNGSDLALLAGLAFAGVALTVADGITTRIRLDTLLRALVWAAAGMALIGVGQFVLQRDFTEFMSAPPLLTFTAPPVGFSARGAGEMFRVAGTAGHYIEFSVLLAMALPLAIHFSRYAADRAQRQRYAGIAALLVIGIPLSVSRTGVLALFVVLVVMLPAWTWRQRLNAAAFAVAMTGAIKVLQPGVIGTLRSLLLNTEDDPSITGRTEDYAAVAPLIAERFWLGRGIGTFLPELYRLLDNQWLLTLVSGGVVGVVGLAVLYLSGAGIGIATYRRARRQAATGARDPRRAEEDRHLAAALTAAIVAAALSAFTYDALYFSSYALTLAVLLGAAGALWRTVRSVEAR